MLEQRSSIKNVQIRSILSAVAERHEKNYMTFFAFVVVHNKNFY